MIEIKGDMSGFIEVQTMCQWDSLMNNGAGGQKLEITVEAGWQLTQMACDLAQLKLKMEELDKEAELRKQNPGLQELYDKYKVAAALMNTQTDDG